MGKKLYDKLRPHYKSRVRLIDWRYRSHEPYHYSDYEGVVQELIDVLLPTHEPVPEPEPEPDHTQEQYDQ